MGVVVGDQQHQGWLGRVIPLYPPSGCLWWHWGCPHWHCALTEDARSLLPPKQIPGHQNLSAARGRQVVCCGHFQQQTRSSEHSRGWGVQEELTEWKLSFEFAQTLPLVSGQRSLGVGSTQTSVSLEQWRHLPLALWSHTQPPRCCWQPGAFVSLCPCC